MALALSLALLGALAHNVAAHGHIASITISGKTYTGYDASSMGAGAAPATPLIAWSEAASDNGFVSPSAYGTGDIICHKSAKPGQTHAAVAAGTSIDMHWSTWPPTHP